MEKAHRYRTFTRRVESREEEDEERNEGQSRRVPMRNEETHPGTKKSPSHIGEREKEQVSASKGVNGPDGGEGKQPIDKTKAK